MVPAITPPPGKEPASNGIAPPSDAIGWRDMIEMADLTQDGILENLRKRYENSLIYTSIGDILIAVNPFEYLPIYGSDTLNRYHVDLASCDALPPHVYKLAANILHRMQPFSSTFDSTSSSSSLAVHQKPQVVVISGESGAGKSETTKHIVNYLAHTSESKDWIQQQVLEVMTVLESFGNAKTVNNDNSSRFGKFMKISFYAQHRSVVGASVEHYLLEKSRVTGHSSNERNFHCFYQLLWGSNDEEREFLKLPDLSRLSTNLNDSFQVSSYVSAKSMLMLPASEDKRHYAGLKVAMNVLRMAPEDIRAVLSSLAAILHIGNLEFQEGNSRDRNIDQHHGGNKSKSYSNLTSQGPLKLRQKYLWDVSDSDMNTTSTHNKTLLNAAQLLGISSESLQETLLWKKMAIRGEVTMSPFSLAQAIECRDALARLIYVRMFSWLVEYCNSAILSKSNQDTFVGVLDIFGFENFEINSFEQLCINHANEKMQQFFVQCIFKTEKLEYKKEGIDVEDIQFSDNIKCLEMIEGKMGIFSILEEQCRLPQTSDTTFVQQLQDQLSKNEHFVAIRKKQDQPMFGIYHYAGEIFYSAEGFLEKNKDTVNKEFINLLGSSEKPWIRTLFHNPSEKDASMGRSKRTIGKYFLDQLSSLVKILSSAEPHYVRCIKPNKEKISRSFNEKLVSAQLKYSGITETINVRRKGFPIRMMHEEFWIKFKLLVPGSKNMNKKLTVEDLDMICKAIFKDKNDALIGSTKIFLKQKAMYDLEVRKQKVLTIACILIQKMVRGMQTKSKYNFERKAIMIVQKVCKGFVYRHRYKKIRKSAIKIQAAIRGWLVCRGLRLLNAQIDTISQKPTTHILMNEQVASELQIINIIPSETKVTYGRTSIDISPKMSDAMNAASATMLKINKPKMISKKPSALVVEIGEKLNNEDRSILQSAESSMKRKLNAMKLFEATQSPHGRSSFSDIFNELLEPSANEFDMKDFAETQRKLQNATISIRKHKPVSSEEVVSHSKSPISAALVHSVSQNTMLNALAIAHFLDLSKILTSTPWKSDIKVIIQYNIQNGVRYPILRDEILFQVCKQITPNIKLGKMKNWELVVVNGLKYLSLCLGSFAPSKLFSKYLASFIRKLQEEGLENSPSIQQQAQATERVFRHSILNTSKNYPPSFAEIESVQHQSTLSCRITFLDGSSKAIYIHGLMTAADCVREICQKMWLTNSSGWSLFQKDGDIERAVRPTETMSDLLYKIESASRKQATVQTLRSIISSFGDPEDTPDECITLKFSFQRRVFINKENILKENNIADIRLLYHQALKGWQAGELVAPRTSWCDLIALWAHITWKENAAHHLEQRESLEAVIPENVLNLLLQSQSFTDEVLHTLENLKDKSQEECMKKLLGILSQDALYGCGFFSVKHHGFWCHPESVVIAISSQNIFFLQLRTKEILASFTLSSLKKVVLLSGNIVFSFSNPESLDETDRYEFVTSQGDEISMLLRDYNVEVSKDNASSHEDQIIQDIPSEDNLEVKIIEIRNKLIEKNVVRFPGPETMLVDQYKSSSKRSSMILRRHRSSSGGSDSFRKRSSTFNSPSSSSSLPTSISPIPEQNARDSIRSRLSLKKRRASGSLFSFLGGSSGSLSNPVPLHSDSAPTSSPALFANGQPSSSGSSSTLSRNSSISSHYEEIWDSDDWRFSKNKIPCSILQLESNDAITNEQCIIFYAYQLSYVGLAPALASCDEKPPYASTIQHILSKAMENSVLADEVFLQLIKQTTGHSESDSKTSLDYWRLMSVCIGTILPSTPEVSEYLAAHLSSTHHLGKLETKFAAYCRGIFNGASGKMIRKCPPSKDEISFRMVPGPILFRVQLSDTQKRALSIGPFTTVKDVIEMLREKLNLKKMFGLALFESYGGLERSIALDEYICDLLFKWETFCKSVKADPAQVRFIFKRLLYHPSMQHLQNNDEERFLLHQSLEEIKVSKFPVTIEEAIMIVALQSQVHIGEHDPQRPDSEYHLVVERYFPAHLMQPGILAKVAAQHGNLPRSMTADEANCRHMNMLRSWALYGSNIFEIRQSFTDDLPSLLWLAVNYEGIHLLQFRSKNLIVSHRYDYILNHTLSNKNIIIVVENQGLRRTYVLETVQGAVIVNLMKSYKEIPIPRFRGRFVSREREKS